MFAGNPGVAQYYADFMQALYQSCRLPVYCISHAGHVTVPHQMNQCQWRLLLHFLFCIQYIATTFELYKGSYRLPLYSSDL